MEAVIFKTLGGLGLFIFGMRIMSDGLKKVAGKKLRAVLSAVSSNRVIACITGTVITRCPVKNNLRTDRHDTCGRFCKKPRKSKTRIFTEEQAKRGVNVKSTIS